jgi:predicted RNA-binding protein associated with RNAse of E/G family
MKLKYADRKGWKRVEKMSWKAYERKGLYFQGWVSELKIHKVREPLIVNYEDRSICIVEHGYKWVQYFPKGESYVITVMLNENKKVVQWYIDICYSHGVTANGVPWYKDLYLDIIIFPDDRRWVLLDEDELDEALQNGAITRKEYEYAWYVTYDLLRKVKSDGLYLMDHEDEIK